MDTYQQLQAALAILETEIAACSMKERECVDKAREFNNLGRQARLDRAGIEAKADPIRKQIGEIAAAMKAEAIEKAKAEAAEKAKARESEALAVAEKAKAEQSELERLRAENEQLKAAAKG